MKINPITVTELNLYVKNKVAEDEYLNNVYVSGEISNFKHHYSGHMYFTLKAENSLIKCVMFKSYTATLNFVPKDGMKVNVLGTVSVYERDGIYQIYAKAMVEDGVGALYEEYEKLKKKLELEGLFDEAHKKPIQFMPKVVGVLTSNTGAVIRDIINVSTRRNPNVNIRLLPVPVQGEGAGIKIAKAIKQMNELKLADVLIIGRGGGSLEDLWPFNEEVVARAIYESEIPIVSAVGHEADFTIADFVADLRAPTPSAAAELVVSDIYDVKNTLDIYENRLKILLKRKTEVMRLRFEKVMASKVYKDPLKNINDKYLEVDRFAKLIENFGVLKIQKVKGDFSKLVAKLDTLSPLKTLSRGYSITEKNGNVVTSAKELVQGDELRLRFVDGEKEAVIK